MVEVKGPSCALRADGHFSTGESARRGRNIDHPSQGKCGGITPDDAPGFPITLSRSGIYQFASNIIVPANKSGILIASRYVTIDLNGFAMDGQSTARDGIRGAPTGAPGASIRNGAIVRFESYGILNYTGIGWIVDDMRVINSGHTGIELGGHSSIVRNSVVINSEVTGIFCNEDCLVEGSVVSHNGMGISVNSGMLLGNTIAKIGVLDCQVHEKSGSGIIHCKGTTAAR